MNKTMKFLFAVALAVMASGAAMAASQVCVYANDNVSSTNTVEGYQFSGSTSTHIGPVATGGAGTTQGTFYATPFIAIGPKSTNLYAADGASNDIALFHINSANCQITLVADYPVGGSGGAAGLGIVISPNGKFLYADNISNSALTVMQINSDGSLSSPIQTVDVGGIAMAISPDGNTLIVTDGEVMSYAVDASTGTLTFASEVSSVNQPSGISIDPQSKFVYIGDGTQGLEIQAVEIGQGSELTYVSEQEFGFRNNSNCLQVSPDDKFLYVSSQNSAELATFTVDSETAQLTLLGFTSDDPPFNKPVLMAITPNGEELFVGGATLGVFKSTLGTLTSRGSFPFLGEGQHASIVSGVF